MAQFSAPQMQLLIDAAITVKSRWCDQNMLVVQQLLLEPLLSFIPRQAWVNAIEAVASVGAHPNTQGWRLTTSEGLCARDLLLAVASAAEAAGRHPGNRG